MLTGVVAALNPRPLSASPADCRLPPTQRVTALPWAQQRLDISRAWTITEGAGVVVAVIDTGVDARHPMLAGAVLPGSDVVNGSGPADTDCQGHGTFVAGILAARRIDGIGFAGVAPAATILPIRQTNDGLDGTASALAAAIVAAAEQGASVINVSIVVATSSPELEAAVRYAQSLDVLVVAAVGNDAQQGDVTQYPAAYPGVLAVGALGPDDQPASFTQGQSEVDVVAPGVDILGPGAGGDGLVVGQQGTSFATPFVAGVAALVRAYRPQLNADQVRHRIQVTADPPASPDPRLGWGVVNPYRAVTAVLPEESGVMPQHSSPGAIAAPPAVTGAARGDPAAVLAALALVGGALVVVVWAYVSRRGRERGWRPAERAGSMR